MFLQHAICVGVFRRGPENILNLHYQKKEVRWEDKKECATQPRWGTESMQGQARNGQLSQGGALSSCRARIESKISPFDFFSSDSSDLLI